MIKTFIGMALIYCLGVLWGWSVARHCYYKYYIEELKLRDTEHQKQIANMKECFKEDLTSMLKEKDVERQDLNNKYVRILDEVSKVTGVDKIDIPSFGTVYLNHSERLRAAMRELNEEV